MIGKVLGNRYEIIEKVGSGGMANVYKAKDRMLNRYVAVKVLHSEYKEDEEFIRRFNIESQAAAALSHQNIVQIYDVGDEDGIQFIVMEFLSGQALKEYIKSKEGGLYCKEAVDYSMQICRALECAHQKHIIHRDIKPQNILLTPEGILKVTDFGIARAANNNTTKMNSTAIGSAHYLSPEQARGGYTDRRSDIYSLGVVMYELFTGKLPFDAETPVAVAMKHIQEQPVPPRKLNPTIPKGIEQIILKAMSKEVRLRYDSASEVLADLKKLYVDPKAQIDEDSNDSAETKKVKTDEIKRLIEEDEAKKSGEEKNKEKTPVRRKKKKKGNILVAGVVAVVSAAIVLIFVLVLAINAMFAPEPTELKVPDLSGLTLEEAEAKLDRLGEDYNGFSVIVEAYENDAAKKETVISQYPEAEQLVSGKSVKISVILSNGPGTVILGNYMGESYAKIEKNLTEKGLEVVKKEENSDSFPSGIIVGQEPSSGESVDGGGIVTLYVSKGSASAVVPSVVGLSEAEARTLIERNNLAVGEVIQEYNNTYVKGLVYDQGYNAYTKVPEGTKVDIFVSKGPGENTKEETNSEQNSTQAPSSTEEKEEKAETTAPTVTDPSQIEEMKTKYLSLILPDDRTKVTIKLVCDGNVIYEKEHNTSTGTAEISLKSRGVINVEIYYDGNYQGTREVKFD